MPGSDLFDNQGELHVGFPDNLYALNPDREQLHAALGSPEFFAFAIISPYRNFDAARRNSFALSHNTYGFAIDAQKVIEISLGQRAE